MANSSVPPTPPPPPPAVPVPGSPDGFGPLDELGDGWEPRREVSHGLITIMGILCILFAMGCGCFHLAVVAPALNDADWSEEARKAQQEQRKDLDETLREIESEQEREQVRRVNEMVNLVNIQKLGVAMRESPHFGGFALRAKISAGFQVAMLVLGFLLLFRARISRPLGILICLGTVAAIIVASMAFPPLMDESLGRAPQIFMDDPNTSAEELAEFRAWADTLTPEMVRTMAISVAATSVVFPFICLLVLLFSGGIRRSLESNRYAQDQNY